MQTVVYMGAPGTNPPWIPRDNHSCLSVPVPTLYILSLNLSISVCTDWGIKRNYAYRTSHLKLIRLWNLSRCVMGWDTGYSGEGWSYFECGKDMKHWQSKEIMCWTDSGWPHIITASLCSHSYLVPSYWVSIIYELFLTNRTWKRWMMSFLWLHNTI